MKLRTNLILTFLVASVLIAILGGITLYQINVIVSPLSDEIPNTLNQLTEASYLDTYALNIRYYDEILTQSARNFVFTQEPKWEERYNNTVELLNNEIENAIRVGDSVDKSFFDNISIANQNLIKLEQEAFLLVNNNEVEKAAKVLESEEYENYKKIYSQGLTDFSNRHETSHEDAIITTTKRISDISENTEKEMAMGSNTIMISIGIIIISSVFLGFFIAKKIVSPVNEISLAAKKISQGELDVKIPKGGFQESNELAHTLEQMIENIKKIGLKCCCRCVE